MDSSPPVPAPAGSPYLPYEPGRLYYRRQLLTRSLEGRRVDLLTVSDVSGSVEGAFEPPLPGVFELDPGPPVAAFGGDKKVG